MQSQIVNAKIVLIAVITLYGICGTIYSAVLLLKMHGQTGSINNFTIYGLICMLLFISGITFLYKLLSKSNPDDTQSELND